MKSIAVVTVGRSDFGIYLPVLRAMRTSKVLSPQLIVAAAHLVAEHGSTINEIIAQGFTPSATVPMTLEGDSRADIARGAGLGVVGFTDAFLQVAAELVLVLGDRFEMHSAALSATLLGIPLAHIHGGEITAGAWDDSLRHSITKLSHVHFVSTQDHRRRVRQLGEENWRVIVSGAPSLDNLHLVPRWTREQLESRLGISLTLSPLLVTYHPVTLRLHDTQDQIDALCDVLSTCADRGRPVIITRPNVDPAFRTINDRFENLARANQRVRLESNLGTEVYFNLMANSAAMVGNSSSGIIEAASFELPVVNIGDRQSGRTRSKNVIDVGYASDEIAQGIHRACSADFRASLHGLQNPYGDGCAAARIVGVLESIDLDNRLLNKQFVDWRDSNE